MSDPYEYRGNSKSSYAKSGVFDRQIAKSVFNTLMSEPKFVKTMEMAMPMAVDMLSKDAEKIDARRHIRREITRYIDIQYGGRIPVTGDPSRGRMSFRVLSYVAGCTINHFIEWQFNLKNRPSEKHTDPQGQICSIGDALKARPYGKVGITQETWDKITKFSQLYGGPTLAERMMYQKPINMQVLKARSGPPYPVEHIDLKFTTGEEEPMDYKVAKLIEKLESQREEIKKAVKAAQNKAVSDMTAAIEPRMRAILAGEAKQYDYPQVSFPHDATSCLRKIDLLITQLELVAGDIVQLDHVSHLLRSPNEIIDELPKYRLTLS